jgi:uncharacterized membrane protein
MKLSDIFSAEEQRRLVATIQEVEQNSSVEIRVHVENHCHGRVLDRAAQVFERLGMRKTEARNGVLIYVAPADRVSAILGDVNVDRYTGPGFWQQTLDEMNGSFTRQRFAEGICGAVRRVGEVLQGHFPVEGDNPNELPDDISYGEI